MKFLSLNRFLRLAFKIRGIAPQKITLNTRPFSSATLRFLPAQSDEKSPPINRCLFLPFFTSKENLYPKAMFLTLTYTHTKEKSLENVDKAQSPISFIIWLSLGSWIMYCGRPPIILLLIIQCIRMNILLDTFVHVFAYYTHDINTYILHICVYI